MRSKFIAEFEVDSDTVIAELRTMRTYNYIVYNCTEEFNSKIARLNFTSAM